MRVTGDAFDPFAFFATSFDPGDGLRPRYNTIGARVPVFPRPVAGERTLGIIVSGQSTISNWGNGTLYTASSSRSHQANIMDGRVYPMADPVFGCDGTTATPASMIGDKLIALGKYDRVTIANVAFGSTSSAQWMDRWNNLGQGLRMAAALLAAHGYETVKHIHQQGEADAASGVSQATMLANLLELASWTKTAGIAAPLYVSQTTFNYGGWVTTNPDPALWTPGAAATLIRNAQAAFPNGGTRLAGPDTDAIRGAAYRSGAHWSTQAGAQACADAWAAVL